MSQFLILFSGALAIFLTQSEHDSTRRFACLVGLVGQPFWLFETWFGGQWGMFLLSVFYSFAWLKGLWLFWFKRL